MGDEAPAGGTDLGRRVAEQRRRAGLTVAEAAERAGMSPDYLAFLESSSMASPTPAALARLAAALNGPPDALSGAGLNLPPGERRAAKNPVLEELSVQECRDLIAPGGVGRFLFAEAGRAPVAIPVNYRMDADDVVFRTGSHGSIASTGLGQPVSFDVDHLDDALGEGWSVLVSGTASILADPAELARAEALHIEPWAGGERDTYVRLSADQLTGRRIRVTG
jgi:transcriptional regulator with XRE-family HTH domain